MKNGFTLAELLIALAILGVIATFTIPKVLYSQQSSQWNSAAKEVAGAMSEAFQLYKQENTLSSSTSAIDLTPYINYVSIVSLGGVTVDALTGATTRSCGAGPCLKMHNGGVLYPISWLSFGGTTNNHVIQFEFDPDGVYSGSTTGPGKSVQFTIFYNGRVSTIGDSPGAQTSGGVLNCPTCDPDWFSWD